MRVQRHTENALKIAQFLQNHPKISWINYPGLPDNPYYEIAKKYMPKGTCGVLCFGVKGGRAKAEEFMGYLKIATIETHVADSHTCCLHPASSTHRQMTDEQLKAAGVPADQIRLSVGLEDADDLIEDIKQALERV